MLTSLIKPGQAGMNNLQRFLRRINFFQGRDRTGMPFPSYLGHLLHFAEVETMGRAYRNAGGFEPGINAVHAIVTFYNLAGFRIPLGCTPRTGGNTCLTSDTKVLIHKDNAVLGPLLHGPCRAGRYTPRVFTVKTGHENEGSPGFAVEKFGFVLKSSVQKHSKC